MTTEWVTNSDIAALKRFAGELHEREHELPAPNGRYMRALENLGRERLSKHFFMRDFMYSEISAVHGIPNIPDHPMVAIEAGKGLCRNLLEPLRNIFGQIVIRSAFRSTVVNGYGSKNKLNCSNNRINRAKHIWDDRDANGYIGATACIVIPRFSYSEWFRENGDWRPLAWFIHDKRDELPYSEMCFFSKNAAFNLTWREREPKQEIYSRDKGPKKYLTKRDWENHKDDHSECYSWFSEL